MNVDRINQKCVLHQEGCRYEEAKRERKWKGLGKVGEFGGWLEFDSIREAQDHFEREWAPHQ